MRLIQDTEAATGIPVTAALYKRPKVTDNPALEPYFAWKGNIACVREEAPSQELFTPELLTRVQTLLSQLRPLYDYFNQFRG